MTVEFTAEDGTVLRGQIYGSPDRAAPGVVMAHGFSGVKEQVAHYAELFAAAGLAVLLFDHRGFGASDGLPRQEVDPFRQIADWRDAITFAASRPEFDADRGFGVWGSSFAGGLAMVIAATDPRVRCVVAQIPNVSGHRNAPMLFTAAQTAEIRRLAAVDRAGRLAGAAPVTLPVFGTDDDELCALPPAVPREFIDSALAGGSTWRNEVTVRSVEHLMEFEPWGWIEHVAPVPLLMIIAANDTCTFPGVQREIFAAIPGPKRVVEHPGGHFDTYTTHFGVSGGPARDWFVEHLSLNEKDDHATVDALQH